MLEAILLLGALFIGYKVLSSSSTSDKKTNDTGTNPPRALDTRTDASRGVSDAQLLTEDLSELPPEIRAQVLKALLDTSITSEEIHKGAEVLLAGCGKDIDEQVLAIIAGGGGLPSDASTSTSSSSSSSDASSSSTSDAAKDGFKSLIEMAQGSWCYPTAAARLMKLAKKRKAEEDGALKTEISIATSDTSEAYKPTKATSGVFDTGIAKDAIVNLDAKKKTLDEILDREIDALSNNSPVFLRDNVRKLIKVLKTWNLEAPLIYDSAWIRSFAQSVDESYHFKRLSEALYHLADIAEAGEAHRAEVDAEYQAARQAQEEDDRASTDWPNLWNLDDKVFQPELRRVARAVKKVRNEDGSYTLEWSGDIDIKDFNNFIINLIKRIAAMASPDDASEGFGSGVTWSGILATLEPIAKFALNKFLQAYGGSFDLPAAGSFASGE